MSHQVATVVRTCVGMLRLLRKLAPLLSFTALCTVVSALIISRLDYGNAWYVGLPDKLLNRLQVVMNDAPSTSSCYPSVTTAPLATN